MTSRPGGAAGDAASGRAQGGAEPGGLAALISGLVEGNLVAHPNRSRLLRGPPRHVVIRASDAGAHAVLVLGGGRVSVGHELPADPHLVVSADSATLLDLTRARLLAGLPSPADPLGRALLRKLATGRLRIKGVRRIRLLTRVQRLLSVG